jgi:hypothetical protein
LRIALGNKAQSSQSSLKQTWKKVLRLQCKRNYEGREQ